MAMDVAHNLQWFAERFRRWTQRRGGEAKDGPTCERQGHRFVIRVELDIRRPRVLPLVQGAADTLLVEFTNRDLWLFHCYVDPTPIWG